MCLLCRARGTWPTWRTGVRTHPFSAHAWGEADGQLIGEPYPAGHYRPLLTIGPPLSAGEEATAGESDTAGEADTAGGEATARPP
ncbi:hypothetical protein GKJPGBOP_07184 [Streptomyces paromomycinus]|uniref:Microcin J25-processing protein McjB C-terminal domain-containing protein n=1 Tax=Streptomyces paromomycinus TaxID=92743 RepID=A0A401WDM7_STREY|nr:hypothetical protein GKJPGBOP_07184 [Streptomyces paromomycinus]